MIYDMEHGADDVGGQRIEEGKGDVYHRMRRALGRFPID